MNDKLRQAFDAAMAESIALYEQGEFARAFQHLELAHVLGQKYVVPHIATHYRMLRIGVKMRSPAQVWGQLIRIVLGALGSAVGVVPVGNTGGTNVGMFRRMPVDDRVRELMEP